MDNRAEGKQKHPSGSSSDKQTTIPRKEQKRLEAERRQQLQPLRNRLKKLERQVEQLTQQQKELEQRLAEPDIYDESNKSLLKQLLADKVEIDGSLAETEELWLETEEELDRVQGTDQT